MAMPLWHSLVFELFFCFCLNLNYQTFYSMKSFKIILIFCVLFCCSTLPEPIGAFDCSNKAALDGKLINQRRRFRDQQLKWFTIALNSVIEMF